MIMRINCENVQYCEKGKTASKFQLGDFVLVNDNTFYSKLIRFGQNFRYRGSSYNKWTHAALITDEQGTIIEATGRGVKVANLSKYTDFEYLVVNIAAPFDERINEVTFARHCLGEQYGWMDILSIAATMVTGQRFVFGLDGQEICSGLVARALERTGTVFLRNPIHITPSELARTFLLSNFAQSTQFTQQDQAFSS